MKTRPLGRAGFETPTVILGAWSYGGWFWGGSDDELAERALHRALDVGMNAIDTAPVYGLGRSEEVIGRALQDRRSEALYFTKVGLRWDDERGQEDFPITIDGKRYMIYRNLRPDSVRHEVEQSLKRLRTDRIDLLQVHWPDPTTPIAETMGEMVRLHAEGKIRAVGVSNYTPEQMDEAAAGLGGVPLASDQPKYNLLNRVIEADIVPHAVDRNIGLIVYSPLEMGLLTGKVTGDREFPRGDFRGTLKWFQTETRSRVNHTLQTVAQPIADRHEATLAQIALAWALHRPGITAVIAGARRPDQADENAGAADIVLSDREVESLTAAFAEVTAAA